MKITLKKKTSDDAEERRKHRKELRETRKKRKQRIPEAAKPKAQSLNADRTIWLDPEGNPPVTEHGEKDEPFPYHGPLLEKFRMTHVSEKGEILSMESFAPGVRLPLAPGYLEKLRVVTERVEEALAKKRKPEPEDVAYIMHFVPDPATGATSYHGRLVQFALDGSGKPFVAGGGVPDKDPLIRNVGKRKRLRDDQLTPEERAKRDRRRAKREARKKARGGR